MCHIYRLWYSCCHGDLVLHSKCLATRIKQTRRKSTNLPYNEGYDWTPVYNKQDTPYYEVAACKAHVTLEINLQTRCGPCRFGAVKRKWEREVAKIKAGVMMVGVGGSGAMDELMEGLRVEREKEEWECRKMFPPEGRKGPITRCELVRKRKQGGSPLRNEVRPEDVEEVEEVDWNEVLEEYDSDQAEDERDVDGGTFMDFFDDRYGWMGPDLDLNEVNLSSLQIPDTDTKDDSMNDSGYSSAETDDEAEEQVFLGH